MKLLVQNKKIKQSSKNNAIVFNFGIPAFKSANGSFTCPNASKCAVGCYAMSGAYAFSNVKTAYEKRYQLTLQSDFPELIQAELSKILKRHSMKDIYIRIHDSGDFYDRTYFEKWRKVMLNNPNVTFYAYTKMVSQFKSMHDLPLNFKLIYSFGGRQDNMIDRYNDRHSMVFESLNELTAQGYVDCSHDDLLALSTNKVGLIYHGAKKYSNTSWGSV